MRIYVANDYNTLVTAVQKAAHEAVALGWFGGRDPAKEMLGERLELIESAGAVLFMMPHGGVGGEIGFDVGYAAARGKTIIACVPVDSFQFRRQGVLVEVAYVCTHAELPAILKVYHRDKSACKDPWHEAEEGKSFFSNRGPCPTCKESHR